MSKLKDLIAELCPHGVEFKKLGELCEIGTGSSDRKNATEDGKYPFYVRSKDILKINHYEFDETAIIIPGEGGIGEIFHFIQGKYALHQRAYRIHFVTDNIEPKFAYYYLSANFKSFIMQKAVSATVTSIRKPMIQDFKIPVPPLPVQNEIVRILDTFTELIATLEEELTARKKQYEYYRDKLLTFKNVPMVKLGEIVILKAGSAISANEISPIANENKKFLCYGGNGIRGYVSSFNRCGKYPIIGRQGALCGNVNFASGEFYATEHAVTVSCNEKFNERFLYHLLTVMNLNQYKTAGAQPGLSVTKLNKIKIPVPPLEEQERIVNILDKFDKLCNDLCEGIPAEIEARKKQYEYYRDLLLTFEEAQ